MDVFLVPIGADRYELYCEVPDGPEEPETGSPRGFFHRLKVKFNQVVAEAERERRVAHAERPRRGWLGQVRSRAMRWVAESIAEQRLLWHLRGQTDAGLFHPDDIDGTQAMALLRKHLGRDFDKHRFWLTFDALGLIVSFILVPIPGPNLLLYYFAFRVVGHYLSVRGARQGLRATQWTTQPRAPLTELRRAAALDPVSREQHVNDIALRLQLEHLATFFQRTAVT
jgi:Mitochondrial K+-H+ exchange-related